jgi:hypothetical protein
MMPLGDRQNSDEQRILTARSCRRCSVPRQRQVPMTGIASRLLAAAVVCLIAVGTVASLAQEQSPDPQAACAAQAAGAFAELGRESREVLERIQMPFDITALDYQAHYSNKADRCLLLVRKALSISHATSDTSYLIAAADRRMYALYIDTDGRMETCALIPSIAETTTCKDRGEFDAFVAGYMGER